MQLQSMSTRQLCQLASAISYHMDGLAGEYDDNGDFVFFETKCLPDWCELEKEFDRVCAVLTERGIGYEERCDLVHMYQS